jgi:uncharacterized protein (TIGR03086 family)
VAETRQAMGDPLALLGQANVVFVEILGNITPQQMSLHTVNDDWDVRALINHVVNGSKWAAAMVRTGDAPRPSGDSIGDRDPLTVYTEAYDDMVAAFGEPGALDRTLQLPFGAMPGAGFAAFRFNDLIGHAWDLAKATRQSTDIAPELCEIALAISRKRLEGRDRAATPFKDEVIVAAEACPADRLAAYLGKQVA